jgi:fucose 4-O-acetylase-like acetyltransferase
MRIVSVILFSVIILFWSVLKLSNLAVVYQMILTLCVLCALMDLKLGRVLCALGSASMAIYLLHTFFSAFLRELLLAISVNSIAIHIGLGTVIGLIGPLILLQIARRTNTTRGLGF